MAIEQVKRYVWKYNFVGFSVYLTSVKEFAIFFCGVWYGEKEGPAVRSLFCISLDPKEGLWICIFWIHFYGV